MTAIHVGCTVTGKRSRSQTAPTGVRVVDRGVVVAVGAASWKGFDLDLDLDFDLWAPFETAERSGATRENWAGSPIQVSQTRKVCLTDPPKQRGAREPRRGRRPGCISLVRFFVHAKK